MAVLTDGAGADDALAAALERDSRAGMEGLGVPPDWFLMLGLHAGTAPVTGRKFEAVVAAIGLIMWRHDCNALVAPPAGDARPDYAACHAIACAVAERTGVALVTYATPGRIEADAPPRFDAVTIFTTVCTWPDP